jgi:hypothetical protein
MHMRSPTILLPPGIGAKMPVVLGSTFLQPAMRVTQVSWLEPQDSCGRGTRLALASHAAVNTGALDRVRA